MKINSLILFVLTLSIVTIIGCGDEFSRGPMCYPSPDWVEVHARLGTKTEIQLAVAVRQPDKPIVVVQGQDYMQNVELAFQFVRLEKEPTDCGTIDVAIVSNTGAIDLMASESMELLRINKATAELVWNKEKVSSTLPETFYTTEWFTFMFQLVDCSDLARPGAVCELSSVLPPYTVGLLGDYSEGSLNESDSMLLVWRSKP